jgi:hypothetical protein
MKIKKLSTARNNVKYTKKYANKGTRQKVGYEHEINRETNLKKYGGATVLNRTYR